MRVGVHTLLRVSLAALGTAALLFASLPTAYAQQVEAARSKEITPDQAQRLASIIITLKDVVKPQVRTQAESKPMAHSTSQALVVTVLWRQAGTSHQVEFITQERAIYL